MMIYDIEVRPGSGQEFFQYYTESVEAPTSSDALARVQRMNPGCQLFLQGSHNNSGKSGGSGIDLGTSTIGVLVLVGIVAFFTFLPYIIVVGAIGLMSWGLYKLVKWIFK
mgnify:CR=1 FL=1